jgi:hypothetical protein
MRDEEGGMRKLVWLVWNTERKKVGFLVLDIRILGYLCFRAESVGLDGGLEG